MRPDLNKYLLFGLIYLSVLLSGMQFTIVAVALPDIKADLNAPDNWVAWVFTVTTIASVASMPILGKLSDDIGRRMVFAGGLIMFALSSLAAAVAPTFAILIAARAFQGLATGSLMPSTMGIVGDAFASNRARAIGLVSSATPVGIILGPNLGGIIVEHFGWRWTFAMNAPAGLLVVVVAFFLIPAATSKGAGKIDFAGVGLLLLSVVSLMFSLTELGRSDSAPNYIIVVVGFLLALIGTIAFLRHESRTSEPVLDLSLLKREGFVAVNALVFFYGASVIGVFVFLPTYAQSGYGMSAGEAGALLTPRAVVMFVASALASLLLPRTGYRRPMMVGLLALGTGSILLSMGAQEPVILGIQLSNFVYLSTLIAISGLAFGLTGPSVNNAAIEVAPDRIAALSGLRGMFMSLGGAIGTAVVVLVMSRASSDAKGLETAFLGLGVLSCITALFALGIPDKVGFGSRAGEGRPPPEG
jgi:EmrB/QacA subfamily drug resistance transporter